MSTDQDRIWAAIDAQRVRVADLLDDLAEEDWRQPSLCAGWTVRDVAGHLTLQQLTWGEALAMMARYRAGFDRVTREAARDRAGALTTGELSARIRGMAGSRRHSAGATSREALIDALVHGQDIAVPLGRTLPVPPDAAAEATTRMWTMRFPPPLPATRAVRSFRLVATDTEWAMGAGPEVRGPIAAIMLVSAGRLTALPELTGPGAPNLATRLSQG